MFCSAYVLQISDVVRFLYGDYIFAKFAGTRTLALMNSRLYKDLDAAHDGALSALSTATLGGEHEVSESEGSAMEAAAASPPLRHHVDEQGAQTDADDILEEVLHPDPSDEVMTGNGDTVILLFGLFVDGVQLHAHGRSTTTVISMKCLDLPGFLVNTNLASFNVAFIGGPKEPSNMTGITRQVLDQFKNFEPRGTGGVPPQSCSYNDSYPMLFTSQVPPLAFANWIPSLLR